MSIFLIELLDWLYMRLWSIHPKYLDAKGLVALWREALLAQAVLLDQTKGYKNHPQLDRFKRAHDSISAIGSYLEEVWLEANRRGYKFDRSKIVKQKGRSKLSVTKGQLQFECEHLRSKLMVRDKIKLRELRHVKCPESHPMFRQKAGSIEGWERTNQ